MSEGNRRLSGRAAGGGIAWLETITEISSGGVTKK
jgi:hypothetical protein